MFWAVIMAGGKGTRFWPESREASPKQFLSLFGNKTLLEETATRIAPVISRSRWLVVGQKSKTSLIRKKLNLSPSQVIGEPVGRNTAPCLVLTAALMVKRDPEAVLAMLPADNRVEKTKVFQRALKAACQTAERSRLPVTFGIRPSFPHTGYGYLEMGRPASRAGGFRIYHLKRFHEKPALQKARHFFKSGRFLWNSGMFVWRADGILEASRRLLPEVYACAMKIAEADSFNAAMKKHFHKMPSISIDYGLMEKMRNKILTIPVDLGWSDVGGWKTLSDLLKLRGDKNVSLGSVVSVNSRGNFIKAGKRLVTLVGVKDLIVVDTADALLVCHKDHTESIRELVIELKARRMHQYL